jgi:hypothetical protein
MIKRNFAVFQGLQGSTGEASRSRNGAFFILCSFLVENPYFPKMDVCLRMLFWYYVYFFWA